MIDGPTGGTPYHLQGVGREVAPSVRSKVALAPTSRLTLTITFLLHVDNRTVAKKKPESFEKRGTVVHTLVRGGSVKSVCW